MSRWKYRLRAHRLIRRIRRYGWYAGVRWGWERGWIASFTDDEIRMRGD